MTTPPTPLSPGSPATHLPDRATVMHVTHPGGPDVLAPATVPLKRPGPGEVLMATRAIGVNHLDLYYRDGTLPLEGGGVDIPGLASVGEVLAIGPGVDRFAPGDRIAHAGPPLGAYATHRVLPVAHPVPQTTSSVSRAKPHAALRSRQLSQCASSQRGVAASRPWVLACMSDILCAIRLVCA